MTNSELGVFDSIAFGIAMLAEIPSGAIADLFGKRNTIAYAGVLQIIGVACMAFALDKYALLFGNTLFAVGYSFYSGAGEALVYDSMVQTKQENHYDTVISRVGTIGIIASTIGAVTGGLLYAVDERLPWFAWLLSAVVSFLISLKLVEPLIDTMKFSLSGYINQFVLGVKELFLPQLRYYFLAFFTLTGVFYIYDTGLVRPSIAASFGYDGVAQGFLNAVVIISASLFVYSFPALRKRFGDKRGIIFLMLSMSLAFFLAGIGEGLALGGVIICLLSIIGHLVDPWISAIVNKSISSQYRATTLSTLAFFTKLPYVVLGAFAGALIEAGQLAQFNLGTAALVLGVAVITALLLFRLRKQAI